MIELNDLEINFDFHTNSDTIDKVAEQFFKETKAKIDKAKFVYGKPDYFNGPFIAWGGFS